MIKSSLFSKRRIAKPGDDLLIKRYGLTPEELALCKEVNDGDFLEKRDDIDAAGQMLKTSSKKTNYLVPMGWACPGCGNRNLDTLNIDVHTGLATCGRCDSLYDIAMTEEGS